MHIIKNKREHKCISMGFISFAAQNLHFVYPHACLPLPAKVQYSTSRFSTTKEN